MSEYFVPSGRAHEKILPTFRSSSECLINFSSMLTPHPR
ncbi:hypothetical protein RHOER0001_1600 [Rhodococcus erythropolis SK121]|nr:hypothetical protein RHOER0001_1600 [Rhodococcus erythropolis SK121]